MKSHLCPELKLLSKVCRFTTQWAWLLGNPVCTIQRVVWAHWIEQLLACGERAVTENILPSMTSWRAIYFRQWHLFSVLAEFLLAIVYVVWVEHLVLGRGVCACVCVRAVTIQRSDPWPIYLARRFIWTQIPRSISPEKLNGHVIKMLPLRAEIHVWLMRDDATVTKRRL